MRNYMAKYSNHSLHLVFADDEYSPKIKFIDDDKSASFNIIFSATDNIDSIDKIRGAAIKAVNAFNEAFENEMMKIEEDELVNEINF